MKITVIAAGLAMGLLISGCGGAKDESPQGLSTVVADPAASAPAADVAGASVNALIGGNYVAARHTPRSQTAMAAFKGRHEFLAGTDMDGNWPVLENGRLEPSIALKRRFDYILLAIGREDEAQLTELLNTLADEELTPSNAALVKDLWQKYIALLKTEIALRPDPKSAASMEAYVALANVKRVELLGKEWAQAFFEEEDKAFRNLALSH